MSAARSAHRHRRAASRNRARAFFAAPLLAAVVGGGIATAQPASASGSWEKLRQCESGGNYGSNTGNGYYGAYQFSLPTWRSLGYSGLPSNAAPGVQDEAARRLAQRSGFSQWPTCGRGMGAHHLAGGSVAQTQASRSTARLTAVPARATSPAYSTHGHVRSWQAQMNKLGYRIAVDGKYGPQSAVAARKLQAAKGLVVDGILGPQTWAAVFGAK